MYLWIRKKLLKKQSIYLKEMNKKSMSIVVEEISNGLVIKKGNSYRIRAIFIGLAIVSFYLVLILPIAYKLIENPRVAAQDCFCF